MKIEALIFDLGGVVFDYSFDKTFETWSIIMDRKADDIKEMLKFSDNFEKFERGDITPQEFIGSISKQLNYEFDGVAFETGWNEIYMDVISDIDSVLSGLKDRYRLVALTNTNQIHAKVWKGKYADTLRHFEKIFSSYEIGTRKPEAKAFQTVLDYLNLAPEQTVFLDDSPEYINRARGLGINAILVTSYDQMISDLASF